MIHEHIDINRICDGSDELIMDEHAIFTLTESTGEARLPAGNRLAGAAAG